MTDKSTTAGIDLDKLTRYDHQGCVMAPDATGDYFLVADVRELLSAPRVSEQADERALWEKWAEHEARVAYRSEKHGLVFYDAGTKTASWVAWQARAALTQQAAPEAPADKPAGLIVATSVTDDSIVVIVSMKQGDVTTVLYSRNHSLNGESLGTALLAAASPAATTASASGNSFRDHLQRCSDEVATWPDWKRAPAPSHEAAPLDDGFLYMCAIEAAYPIPNNPHNSVVQRAMDSRIAFRKGWDAARDAVAQQGAGQAAQAGADETKDAARYRWLRDKSEPGICAFYLSVGQAFKGVKFARETVDEAIDAAMSAATASQKGEQA
jgi:hypothetical protein